MVAGSIARSPSRRQRDRGVFHDVTTEHNREFLTAQFLKRLFDELPTAIAVSDPETREILSVNLAFLDLVGYGEEEVVGSTPPYRWLASHQELAHGPREETVYRHRDGQ